MTYDFNYQANEGDTYQSNEHPTLAAAKAEWASATTLAHSYHLDLIRVSQ